RMCIKFYFRNGITAIKTLEMLQKAFGDNSLSKITVFEWYKIFKEGKEGVQ
ncbi:hypothetical protein EAI_10974, partial [Harpegnathos saltator]